MELSDGMIIALADLPTTNLNIRAETSSNVGSLVFSYDDNTAYRTENSVPYAIGGDSGGDYYAWNMTVGTHALGATPYSGGNGSGTPGQALKIVFDVRESTIITPSPSPTTPVPTTHRHL